MDSENEQSGLMSQHAQRALAIFETQVGTEDSPGSWITIDQARINAFAETTLDRQFIHVDPVQALEKSPYGVTIAHGFLTLSLLSHMVQSLPTPEPNPYVGVAAMINYGLDRVRWPTPVKVNARIRARRTLISAELKEPRTIQLKSQITVDIEGEAKPGCVAEWITRVIYA